jgi:hypothetical protein
LLQIWNIYLHNFDTTPPYEVFGHCIRFLQITIIKIGFTVIKLFLKLEILLKTVWVCKHLGPIAFLW